MPRHSLSVVDIDDGRTWPAGIRMVVGEIVNRTSPETHYRDEIQVGIPEQDVFSRLMDGRYLRTYHCTKLLPHELDRIHQHGLQPLTLDLVEERIMLAASTGYIGDEECRQLLDSNAFAMHDAGRAGATCLLFGRQVFDDDWRSLWRLLSLWGGEAIYWQHADVDDQLFAKLKAIGTPTVLVLNTMVTEAVREPTIYSSLLGHFVARELALSYQGEGRTHLPTPPNQVIDVWQPGNPRFEAFPGLAKAIA